MTVLTMSKYEVRESRQNECCGDVLAKWFKKRTDSDCRSVQYSNTKDQ